MSNYLAVATVTATLQLVLRTAISLKMSGAEVTAVRPEAIGNVSSAPGINVYLYQATPNPAFRNQDLPLRRNGGQFMKRPQAALDLYYILTFHGREEQFDRERLLSLTTIALYSKPVLTRDDIVLAIGSATGGMLAGSDLATQSEPVKLTPVSLSLDELHKLWSIFSPAPYQLSAVYIASLVLLEDDVELVDGLPVTIVQVQGNPEMRPSISDIGPRRVAFGLNTQLNVTGDGFGPNLVAVIGTQVIRPIIVSNHVLRLPLPTGLSAGEHNVRLARVQTNGTELQPVLDTAPAPFTLEPVIQGSVRYSLQADPSGGPDIQVVTVQPGPALGPTQNAELRLNAFGNANKKSAKPVFKGLLRFYLDATLLNNLLAQKMSEALRFEFRQNGIVLGRDVHIESRGASAEILIIDEIGDRDFVYAVRPAPKILSVYAGLTVNDAPNSISFQFLQLEPGSYLVRLVVDAIESPLEVNAQGAYDGPLVEVS